MLGTGEPQFYPTITDDMLAAAAVDAEHLRIMREIDFTGAIIVPISARGRTLGALTLVSAESGKRYTREDLVLAEELGNRAGVAIDNGRLLRDALVARAEADRARAVALSAKRAKPDFLATMSHEIRIPINGVVGYAELLALELSARLTDDQRLHLERIRASTRHPLRLSTDVLDLAKIEAGTLRVEQGEAIAGDSSDAALALVRPQGSRRASHRQSAPKAPARQCTSETRTACGRFLPTCSRTR